MRNVPKVAETCVSIDEIYIFKIKSNTYILSIWIVVTLYLSYFKVHDTRILREAS